MHGIHPKIEDQIYLYITPIDDGWTCWIFIANENNLWSVPDFTIFQTSKICRFFTPRSSPYKDLGKLISWLKAAVSPHGVRILYPSYYIITNYDYIVSTIPFVPIVKGIKILGNARAAHRPHILYTCVQHIIMHCTLPTNPRSLYHN